MNDFHGSFGGKSSTVFPTVWYRLRVTRLLVDVVTRTGDLMNASMTHWHYVPTGKTSCPFGRLPASWSTVACYSACLYCRQPWPLSFCGMSTTQVL